MWFEGYGKELFFFELRRSGVGLFVASFIVFWKVILREVVASFIVFWEVMLREVVASFIVFWEVMLREVVASFIVFWEVMLRDCGLFHCVLGG